MVSNSDVELKELNRKIIKSQFLAAPGAALLGLGLYGMFAAKGHAFHPLLNDQDIVYSLVICGIAMETWQLMIIIPLLKRKATLQMEKLDK